MCTRALYVADDGTVITGRNMDWAEDQGTNLWAFPAGMARDGAAGAGSFGWTSKHGSVVVAGYEAGATEGLNEKGLNANLLYLAESDFGAPRAGKPPMSVAAWAQYALDVFATVAEATAALREEPFSLIAPELPNGRASTVHLSLSDVSGDSAIFEYVAGKLVIHHGRQYVVMTNSPTYEEQLAINRYWEEVGGQAFVPGTVRAADRFVRTSFFLKALPRKVAPAFIRGVPGRSFQFQAAAAVLSLMRAVSVPLGITSEINPNLSSTLWRTVADQTNRVLYFDSATTPDAFWVSLDKLDLKPGAPARRLTIQDGEVFSGETSDKFEVREPFKVLAAQAA